MPWHLNNYNTKRRCIIFAAEKFIFKQSEFLFSPIKKKEEKKKEFKLKTCMTALKFLC